MAAETFPQMSISAEWEVANLWNHYFYRVFRLQNRTNFSPQKRKIVKIPIFLGSFMSMIFGGSTLAKELPQKKQFYTGFIGVLRDFDKGLAQVGLG